MTPGRINKNHVKNNQPEGHKYMGDNVNSKLIGDDDKPFLEGKLIEIIVRVAKNNELGEIIMTSGKKSARIFIANGEIAWVRASTIKQTLSSELLKETGLDGSDLQSVFDECKRDGSNFGETVIEWGLISRENFRQILLQHISSSLAVILTWKNPQMIFVNSDRVYNSTLTFKPEEVFADINSGSSGKKKPKKTTKQEMDTDDMKKKGSKKQGTSISGRPAQDSALKKGSDQKNTPTIKGDHNMEKVLAKFKSIKGFLDVALLSAEGEVMAEVSTSDMHLAQSAALANDVLLKAQEETDIIGVGRGSLLHITAPKAHVLMRCLNENTDFHKSEPGRAHIHLLLVLEADGNIALAKMQIDKAVMELAEMVR